MRLKATPRYGISTLQSAAEYEQEAAVLSRLRHPNVVTFIGGAIGPDGERALVYELMDAGTVDDRLFPRRDGPKLPPLHWLLCCAVQAPVSGRRCLPSARQKSGDSETFIYLLRLIVAGWILAMNR